MRDKTHNEQIVRWVQYIKDNPGWKKHHTTFINAQYHKAQRFIREQSKTEPGRKKIMRMYGIKNEQGYPELLGK